MNIINIGIMAHVDAGKTTVTEGFLYHSGIKSAMGNVDRGTTTTDSMGLEKERGMTIRSATVSFMIGGTKVNLMDTPGHVEFIAEVERALSVLDGVILVVSAKEGIQPQTRTIYQKLRQMNMPTLIFMNKIDRIGVDLEERYEEIRHKFDANVLKMQTVESLQVRNRAFCQEEFQEEIAEISESILEKYLAEEEIFSKDCEMAIREEITNGRLFPIYYGTALRDVGITELMEAIETWFVPKRPKYQELSAYVYKVVCDNYGHKQSFIRIFSGQLQIRMRTVVMDHKGTESKPFVVRNLFGLEHGAMVPKVCLNAGDAAVIVDSEELRCGSFLGKKERMSLFTQTEPLLEVGIRPIPSANRRILLNALQILAMEDPYLDLNIIEETEEIVLKLFGNLQKEIILNLLEERFQIKAEFDQILTVKKDKPLDSITCIVPMNSPGNLLRAGIGLLIEPLAEGTGFEYVTKVSYGDLTKSFQNGVREGVEKGIRKGLNGEVVDTRVTFVHSEYDSVTSTPADFRKLAEKVVYQALKEVGVMTMEPVMTYTLTAPQGYESKIISELVRMNALMEETSYTQEEIIIKGNVRLDTCKDFPVQLLTMTGGRGIFETVFWQYQKCE